MSADFPTLHHGEASEAVTLSRKDLEALLEVAAERGAERGAKKALQALQQGPQSVEPPPTVPAAVVAVMGANQPAAVALPLASVGWVPEWGTIGQAERILMRSTDTTVKRVREEGLGACRHGRWVVDLARVRAWLEGLPFPALDPYPQSDSVKFGKTR